MATIEWRPPNRLLSLSADSGSSDNMIFKRGTFDTLDTTGSSNDGVESASGGSGANVLSPSNSTLFDSLLRETDLSGPHLTIDFLAEALWEDAARAPLHAQSALLLTENIKHAVSSLGLFNKMDDSSPKTKPDFFDASLMVKVQRMYE